MISFFQKMRQNLQDAIISGEIKNDAPFYIGKFRDKNNFNVYNKLELNFHINDTVFRMYFHKNKEDIKCKRIEVVDYTDVRNPKKVSFDKFADEEHNVLNSIAYKYFNKDLDLGIE